MRKTYRDRYDPALASLVQSRLTAPYPNGIDTFRFPVADDPWIVAPASAVYFSQRVATARRYVIAYFVDEREKTLVLTRVDVVASDVGA